MTAHSSRPPVPPRRRLLAGLTLVAALASSCGTDRALDPLPVDGTGAGVVAGAVRDLEGKPAAGVPVTLEAVVDGRSGSVRGALARARDGRLAPAGAEPGGFVPAAAGRVAVADASGRFAFPGVAAGAYLVTAQSRDHLAQTARIEVPAMAAETTFVNLSLVPTGTFTGQATLDGETAHTGTVVYVEGTSYVAVTDATGAWVMRQVPVGAHTLRAMHHDFLDETLPGTLAAAGDSVDVGAMVLLRDRNLPPTATASAGQFCTSAGPVELDGTGSDPDGSIDRFEWDFDDDGDVDYSSPTSAAVSHAYAVGTHTARLSVRDDDGAYAHSFVGFTVEDGLFYVDAVSGTPAGPGTAGAPFNTIAGGVAAAADSAVTASCSNPIVIVAAGTYNETPLFPSGITVLGGYTAGPWTRTPGTYSDVNVSANGARIVDANNVHLEGLRFQAANATLPGASSFALVVINSTVGIEIVDCRLLAGNGAAGTAGDPGLAGGNGGAGQIGGAGTSGGSGGGLGGNGGFAGNPGGTPGGSGGLGGYDTGSGANGSSVGGCNLGGNGGGAGNCSSPGADGFNGLSGCAGANGSNGAVAGAGTLGITGWNPGNGGNGTAGLGGRGASGGGGGGGGSGTFPCTADRGGGGAGGGGGGGFGSAGEGGTGGGASIAFLSVSSTPVVTRCVITSATGGAGGNGGGGGARGLGGTGAGGGPGPGDGGNGGNSFPGGNGGHGGSGAGGSGGPSWSAAWTPSGSAPVFAITSFVSGAGGAGGSGGIGPLGPAAAGPNGASGSTHSEAPGPIRGAVSGRMPVATR